MKQNIRIILTTCPTTKVARSIAQLALKGRTAACVNIIPGVESNYWWQGKICREKELLLIIKTSAVKVAPLKRMIMENHPYDTPEFVVLKPNEVSPKYAAWLMDSLT